MTPSPWLTPAEAAERARCAKSSVLDALRSQELRGYQTGKGGRWRIHVEDLDAWIRGEIAEIRIPSVTRRRAS